MSYGVLGCSATVEQVDRSTQVVKCPDTCFEGIWSTLEPPTLRELWQEHAQAHDNADRFDEYQRLRRQAYHIWRTTEPNDPARNGIGAYLNYR